MVSEESTGVVKTSLREFKTFLCVSMTTDDDLSWSMSGSWNEDEGGGK